MSMIPLVVLGLIGVAYLAFLAVGTINSPWSIAFTLIAAGFGYSVWWFVSRTHVEFEYCLTNEFFDIDSVVGKKKRSRIVEINCLELSDFGDYDEETSLQLQKEKFDTVVTACNLSDEGVCYLVVNLSKFGKTLVLITPNEKIREALNKFGRLKKQSKNDFIG